MLERARLKNNEKRIAELEAELDCGEFPASLEYLWSAFRRLRRRKGSNGFEVSPIEWPDIDAFIRNTKIKLAPWEIEVIEDIDDLYRAEQAKRYKQENPQKS